MVLISFNIFIQNGTTGWGTFFNATFPHRAQSVYLRHKSEQFFLIGYLHGDITKQFNIMSNLHVIELFPKIVD